MPEPWQDIGAGKKLKPSKCLLDTEFLGLILAVRVMCIKVVGHVL